MHTHTHTRTHTRTHMHAHTHTVNQLAISTLFIQSLLGLFLYCLDAACTVEVEVKGQVAVVNVLLQYWGIEQLSSIQLPLQYYTATTILNSY